MRWWKWPVVPDDPSGHGGWLVAFDDTQLTGLDMFTGARTCLRSQVARTSRWKNTGTDSRPCPGR